jgi:hypothetical protein
MFLFTTNGAGRPNCGSKIVENIWFKQLAFSNNLDSTSKKDNFGTAKYLIIKPEYKIG